MEFSDIWSIKNAESLKQDDDGIEIDEPFICEYVPRSPWKHVSHQKEAMPFINAYDTEWHLHERFGINKALEELRRNFSSSDNPEEIRLSSNSEAKDYLYSVRDQDWFQAAFHPVLAGYNFDVVSNSRMGAAAHFKYRYKPLTISLLTANPHQISTTLFDASRGLAVHNKKCARCKGSGQICNGDISSYGYYFCNNPFPCKNHPGANPVECAGILTQQGKIINPYQPGGKIEYGKVTGFSRNKLVLLHELAHVVTPFGTTQATAHGPEFLGSLGYIYKHALDNESYEAFRRGTREQARARSLDSFVPEFTSIDPEAAQHITEDAPAKGQKRIITPTREKAIQREKVKRQRRKNRDPLADFFPDIFG